MSAAGDFDGSSAFELLNAVNDHMEGADRVIIQTDSLRAIHPFGMRVLENNLADFKRRGCEVIFTGDKTELKHCMNGGESCEQA